MPKEERFFTLFDKSPPLEASKKHLGSALTMTSAAAGCIVGLLDYAIVRRKLLPNQIG
jgi:hypothetical protein